VNPEANKGKIFQINASNGGVPKLARLEGQVTFAGLVGDNQRDKKHHGGPDQALCIYSLERILALQDEGHPLFPGAAGENLTLSGVDWSQVIPGVCLRLGDAVRVLVTNYTTPCSNLIPFFLDGGFNRIHQSLHPGWSRVYTRVIEEGTLHVGDAIRLEA
jgi:MOSC domain-containing protein YiiM